MFKRVEFHLSALRIQGLSVRMEWDVLCAAILLTVVMILSAVYGNYGSSEQESSANSLSARLTPDIALQTVQQIGLFLPSDKLTSGSQNPWRQELLAEDDPAIRLAPPTLLPLKLTGIIYNTEATKRLAILEQADGQITLVEGSNVQGQPAEIRRIFPDMVIILTRGEYASVRFYTPNKLTGKTL